MELLTNIGAVVLCVSVYLFLSDYNRKVWAGREETASPEFEGESGIVIFGSFD